MENAHDTVDIVELNDRVFEAKGQGGKLYKYVNKYCWKNKFRNFAPVFLSYFWAYSKEQCEHCDWE